MLKNTWPSIGKYLDGIMELPSWQHTSYPDDIVIQGWIPKIPVN